MTLFLSNSQSPKFGVLAICAVFRDESPFLDEWLRFHKEQGVSHFFLYNDGSSDNFRRVLAPWKSSGMVSLRSAKGRTQEEIYNHCLGLARKRFKWVGFIDLDEFLFCPHRGGSVPEILQDYSEAAAVFIFWKLFGSNNKDTPRDRGVLESFTSCLESPKSLKHAQAQFDGWEGLRSTGLFVTGCPIQGKSIVNTQKVQKMGIHFPKIYLGDVVDETREPLPHDSSIQKTFTAQRVPSLEKLRINHYWSRGRESLLQKIAKPGIATILRSNPLKTQTIEIALEWESNLNSARDHTILSRWRPISAPRVFLIGFNKTATRAFSAFFDENGMPAVHWDSNKLTQTMVANLDRGRPILEGYDQIYRFYSDFISVTEDERVEGNSFFREMDSHYPGSYFILNNRKTSDWLRSRERHNSGRLLRLELARQETKDVDYVRKIWASEKEKHEKEVREYFKGRNDFLEIDIDSTDIPQKISEFLDMDFDHSRWRIIGKTI